MKPLREKIKVLGVYNTVLEISQETFLHAIQDSADSTRKLACR